MARTPAQIIGHDALTQLIFEGYAVVPREPSEEMEDAADEPFWEAMKEAKEWAEKYGKPIGYASGSFSRRMYRAMIAATEKE